MSVHCFYCGVETNTLGSPDHNPRYRTRDHIIPKIRGGKFKAGNILICCIKCNREKGCLTFDEFRAAMALRKNLVTISVPRVFPGERFPKTIFARKPELGQKLEILLDSAIAVAVVFVMSKLIPALVRNA